MGRPSLHICHVQTFSPQYFIQCNMCYDCSSSPWDVIPLIGGVGGLYYIPWTGGTVITLITLDKYCGKKVWTWQMWREGRPIMGKVDYIFISDIWNFLNVGVREPRGTTNHRVLLACLQEGGPRQNRIYWWGHTIFPIVIPEGGGGMKKKSGSNTYIGSSRSPRAPWRWVQTVSQRIHGVCQTKGPCPVGSDRGTNGVI